MITVDMPTLQQSIARWNSFVAGKIDMLQVNGQGVVKVEAGRLVQTLIKVTPPDNLSRTQQKISGTVFRVFEILEEAPERHSWDDYAEGGKAGRGDVRWYAFQPSKIFGVAATENLSKSGGDAYYAAYYRNRTARLSKHYDPMVVGRRGKQSVYILKKIVSSPARVKELAARLKGHVGRAKAGWLLGWEGLGRPGGVYTPPAWVTKHGSGARGYAINGLGDARFPQFTIENHAKGIGSAKMNGLAKTSMDIRSNAMVKRMTYLLEHPEKIAEEVPAEDGA